jgi:DNA invertase Pin-like site-specific DNA recombinase
MTSARRWIAQGAMLRERVMSGLARARAQGTRLGRPGIAQDKAEAIRRAKASGKGIRRIARELGVGVGTVLRVMSANRMIEPRKLGSI